MVEMLISVMIGIFIILGAGVIYNSSRQTFEIRDAVAAANESSRFAIQDMRRTLVMAGRGIAGVFDSAADYYDGAVVADNGLRTFPVVNANGTAAETATGIVDIDSRGSSVIAIRYASGPAPCGQAGTIAANTTVRFLVNANNELECDDGVSSQPLISGVARMRALYGVDTDGDDYANTYWTASQVQADKARWINVVAIRVGMIINSAEVVLPSGTVLSDAQTLSLLGSDYVVPAADSNLFHKAVSTTFYLRNKHISIQKED
jgi:type IV pilus assembly protein PilW